MPNYKFCESNVCQRLTSAVATVLRILSLTRRLRMSPLRLSRQRKMINSATYDNLPPNFGLSVTQPLVVHKRQSSAKMVKMAIQANYT